MKQPWSNVALVAALLVVALIVELSLNFGGWFIALVLVVLLLQRLSREYQVKQWLMRPRRAIPAKVGRSWQTTLKQTQSKLENARNRSRTFLSALQRVRTTSDYLPDAWITLQRNGEIEMFNQSATSLFGIKPSDVGANLSSLIRHPSLSQLLHNPATELIEITSPVDESNRIEIRLIEIDRDRWLVIARDVTELNRLLTMRQDFIANVSHELRTPLTVLLGYVESMVRDDLPDETIRELANRLMAPVDRMRFMVDDLLTLTRLEAAPLPSADEIQSINGLAQLNLVVEEVALLKKGNHTIRLDADEELRVECVPSEIHSAFINLVTNAIRYSPDGGRITIRWQSYDGQARFEVEDEGIGIPAEFISRLTERFYRVDIRGSRAYGGTGLGLAIVKHVLRRHQSELQIESEVAKGSRFYFDLPLTFSNNGSEGTTA